jgi:hypothetical protein
MKLNSWRPWLGALALVAAGAQPAWAGTVTFEGAPTGLNSIFEDGQSFTSEGIVFTPTAGFNIPMAGALVGAINDPGSPLIGLEPINTSGRYYAGYNDGAVKLTGAGNSGLRISSLDFSFLAFAPGFYGPGSIPGALVADYEKMDGTFGFQFFLFGAANANGQFAFTNVSGAGLGNLDQPLRSVTFYACGAVGNLCVNPTAFGDGWFALDNVVASQIPLPSTLSLVALALVGAGVLRKRSQPAR